MEASMKIGSPRGDFAARIDSRVQMQELDGKAREWYGKSPPEISDMACTELSGVQCSATMSLESQVQAQSELQCWQEQATVDP